MKYIAPSSPHIDKIFDTRKDTKDLYLENSKLFYSLVAQLLYISKIFRPDLDPILFLTSRVSKPIEDDWIEVRNIIGHLKQIKNPSLILKVHRTKFDIWSINATYAVHVDCKSHTGSWSSNEQSNSNLKQNTRIRFKNTFLFCNNLPFLK